MNIFFAINDKYIKQLCVTIVSILENNKDEFIHFYILSSDLTEKSKNKILKIKKRYQNWDISFINPDINLFKNLKLNLHHISIDTYFRYVIADVAQHIDKALYLDADLIVNGSLKNLYNSPFNDNYCVAVKDSYIEQIDYKKNIGFNDSDLYINAGVLLLNLKKIRENNLSEKFFKYTAELCDIINFQDQDIINIAFKGNIQEIDNIYNFTSADVENGDKNIYPVVIHYTGKRKPWLKKCTNELAYLWKKYEKIYDGIPNKKVKVALLIDEFFGGANTPFGGYGFLARKYVAKYIPDNNIHIDVLLGKSKSLFRIKKYHEDNVTLYKLPKSPWLTKLWLKKQKYDIYLSIELTYDWVLKNEPDLAKKLVLWIQDPRPKSAWDNVIDTMQSIKDPSFFTPSIYDAVNNWAKQDRVKFISQGVSLNSLAMELYNLPQKTPIQYLPNPIELDLEYNFDITKKKKQIIFLGRLEAQKRCWLFCEIAKRMPEYEFYVLGKFCRYKEDNERMLKQYMDGNIPNLHFVGHVDGKLKEQFLKESRILLNTAIWEGIPISWLEALQYGTVLVSNLERENLAGRFGTCVGDILGDGFDQIDKFIPAIKKLMENDALYTEKALSAINYIRETHNINRFQNDLKNVLLREVV